MGVEENDFLTFLTDMLNAVDVKLRVAEQGFPIGDFIQSNSTFIAILLSVDYS